MSEKEILGFLSVTIALLSYGIYALSVFKNKTKPHVFTWIIWGLSEAIAFFAQYIKGAGPGAWVTGIDAIVTLTVAALAFTRGESNITRSDWVAFIGALLAIPLWYVTKDPLGAVILISLIDSSAYYPTFRKSWAKPLEEPVSPYALGTMKFSLAIFAMTSYSLVTVLYPVCIVVMNIALIAMLLQRRVALATK